MNSLEEKSQQHQAKARYLKCFLIKCCVTKDCLCTALDTGSAVLYSLQAIILKNSERNKINKKGTLYALLKPSL